MQIQQQHTNATLKYEINIRVKVWERDLSGIFFSANESKKIYTVIEWLITNIVVKTPVMSTVKCPAFHNKTTNERKRENRKQMQNVTFNSVVEVVHDEKGKHFYCVYMEICQWNGNFGNDGNWTTSTPTKWTEMPINNLKYRVEHTIHSMFNSDSINKSISLIFVHGFLFLSTSPLLPYTLFFQFF